MYKLNKIGPRTDPCGTPQSIVLVAGVEVGLVTDCDMPSIYDRNTVICVKAV